RFIPVGRDQIDAGQVFVIMVRFGLAADPAQHEVDRRDQLNFHCIRIERVFTGSERRAPDTAMADLNLFAITERFAGRVVSGGAMIRNNHAYVTNRDQGLRLNLNCAKPAIDEERAVRQHLQLFAALSSELQERFRILEIIVISSIHRLDLGSNNFTRANGWPVLDTDYTDGIHIRIELRHFVYQRRRRARFTRTRIADVSLEMPLYARSDNHWIKRAQAKKLRLPQFVTIS